MEQFLLDLHKYCLKYKICFGDLSPKQQIIVIRKTLKFVLKHNLSKRQRAYLNGNLDFNDLLLSFYSMN